MGAHTQNQFSKDLVSNKTKYLLKGLHDKMFLLPGMAVLAYFILAPVYEDDVGGPCLSLRPARNIKNGRISKSK